MARMCSPTVSIPLLQMLVKLTQAKTVVEVGVFTGRCCYLVWQKTSTILACMALDSRPILIVNILLSLHAAAI